VLAVDSNDPSAEETVAMARQYGTECLSFEAGVTNESTLAATVEAARRRWGRIDVLHYNVGVSIAGGTRPSTGSPRMRSIASLPSTCVATRP
jgi:NAD(P)-dependent dehydrogenase (short-subunit alcohol dehydrogenase family)